MGYDAGALSSEIARLQEEEDGTQTRTSAISEDGTTAAFTWVSGSRADALTAVGTDRDTALALTAQVNQLTGGDTGTGVTLPDIATSGGADVILFNDGAEDAKVYAPGSITIDGVAGATGVTLSAAARAQFVPISSTAYLSALMGAVSA